MLFLTEPVVLTTLPIDGLAPNGRLRVALPHWSAFIELHDQDARALEDAALGASDDEEVATAILAPGAYQLTVRLDGRSQILWVSVIGGFETIVPREAWKELIAAGPAPAPPGTVTNRRAEAALRASLGEARPAWLGGDAQLFVFIESAGPAARRLMSRLELVPPGNEPLRLRSMQTSASSRGQWSIAHISAPPGGYLLRDNGEANRPGRTQPIFLPRYWQSQLVLAADHLEPLATMIYSLARPDAGFDPRQDERVLASTILKEIGGNALVGSLKSHPTVIARLKDGFKDQWLAVLVAYVLLNPTSSDQAARELGQGLLQTLRDTIGDHPDVKALDSRQALIDDHFQFPMLREGFRRALQDLSGPARAELAFPRGLVADSPWTAWYGAASPEAGSMEAALQLTQTALPSSAPIFPLEGAVGNHPDPSRDPKLMRAGYDALQKLIAAKEGSAPLSLVAGVHKSGAAPITQFELSTTLGEPVSGKAISFDGPTIDDEASDLLSWADELASSKVDPTGELAQRVKSLAFGLLDQADLVVVSDDADRPLYANGAVTALSVEYSSDPVSDRNKRFSIKLGGPALDGAWTKAAIDGDDRALGYVHTLTSNSVPMSDDQRSELRRALHRLSLQTGLAVHGDVDRRKQYLSQIEDLITRCEGLVSNIPQRS